MKATVKVDKAGRVVIPKSFRERLELDAGSMLKAEIVGDRIVLTEEVPEAKIVRSKEGLPVIVGWEGFDAAVAVREARQRQLDRLDAPSRQ
ncbi:MAG TPA: AbrB/MazE/SpoVT family DNA-binding domain-containing protein [Chthoniobacteraceae bacterium]|jgi:AbrB family looped-hinge helix DNA binding protein|nr:AbrB/MazE/SpoVT family DNA-binding domain-containing protein [Chthoniobacteraceae bacterium]